ncbi:hypothetical protein AAF712_010888 [Marasmius tenuissimus]|uniref:Uncharacterized protein n=1 Tax=Marasmius tenuissimus TaxID=585030 RepID=A0ABR2ZLK3_9AGAR
MPPSKEPDQPKKSQGRESWVKGEKLEYLLGLESIWRKNSQEMYRVATKGFIDRWGYDLRPETAPEPRVEYVVEDINEFPEGKERVDKEIRHEERRKEVYGMIGNWAWYRWRKKKVDVTAITAIMRSMTDLHGGTYPRRAQEIQFYQNKHWDSKFRDKFETYWNVAKKRMNTQARLREMNRFVEQKWAKETEEYHDKIQAEIDSKYQQDVADYNCRQQWENSAEGYSDVWRNVDSFLPYLVDALAKFTGSGVSLFLYGPREDSHIQCDSSVVPDTQTTRYLKDFDKEAYGVVHDLCQRFAQATFSQAYCDSRKVSKMPEAQSPGEEEDLDSDADSDGKVNAFESTGCVFQTSNSAILQVVGADGPVALAPKDVKSDSPPKNVKLDSPPKNVKSGSSPMHMPLGSPPKIRKNVAAPSEKFNHASTRSVAAPCPSSTTTNTIPTTVAETPAAAAGSVVTSPLPSASDQAPTLPPNAQNLLTVGHSWDFNTPHVNNWQGRLDGQNGQIQGPVTGPTFYDSPPQLYLSSSSTNGSTNDNMAHMTQTNTGMPCDPMPQAQLSTFGMPLPGNMFDQHSTAVPAENATRGIAQGLQNTHEISHPGTDSILQDLPIAHTNNISKLDSDGKENNSAACKTDNMSSPRPPKRHLPLDNAKSPLRKKTKLMVESHKEAETVAETAEDNGEADGTKTRSKRTTRPPARLSDYVSQSATTNRSTKKSGPADALPDAQLPVAKKPPTKSSKKRKP